MHTLRRRAVAGRGVELCKISLQVLVPRVVFVTLGPSDVGEPGGRPVYILNA